MDKLANGNHTKHPDYSSSAAKLEYELITTHIDDSDHMRYTTYGVSARDKDGNLLAEYPDVSTSKEYVKRFIDMLDARDVAPVHIGDLLEDYLD